jgi:hypothetical protein
MKPKFFLLTIGLLGFVMAKANSNDPKDAKGKKEDLVGLVVHSETKKPIKDVSVTAYSNSKKEKITLTDEEGNYSFDELRPGIYKFIFEKSGFKRVTKEKIVVKTDEAFQLNIEMIEAGDFDLMPSPLHFTDVK